MVRSQINKILMRIIGYRITRAGTPSGKCGAFNDPREVEYSTGRGSFIMTLPFKSGGDWAYAKYDTNSLSPYYQAIAAAQHYIDRDKKAAFDVIRYIIAEYARTVFLKGPNDLLGLSAAESKFQGARGVWEMALPWDAGSIDELAKRRIENVRRENLRYGLRSSRNLTDGYEVEEKVRVETQRTWELFLSLRRRGFVVDQGNMICARVYVKSDRFVWRVSGGMHRAAILAAMGYDSVPVKVTQIIRYDDWAYWPNVQAGVYTQENSQALFDRIFYGQAPAAFSKWAELVQKKSFQV